MGRVKDHWHEEICAGACEPGYGQEPDELEMLAQDAIQANDRFLAALMREKQNERTS